MRVLQLVLGDQIWGIERYILNLSRCLKARGDIIFAVCSHEGAVKQELEKLGVETALVPMSGYLDFQAVNEVKRLIARWQPDVMHAHMGLDSFLAAVVSSWTKVPLVLSVHFLEPAYASLPYVCRQIWRFTQMGKNQLVKHFLPVSEAVASRLKLREFVAAEKITVIYPGVQLPRAITAQERADARAKWDLPDDEVVVASIARLTREKGVDVLIAAAKRVVTAYPQARFLIAGEGPERQSLQAQVESLKLESNVRMLDYVSNPREVMAAADLVVVASRSEAFGFVPVESVLSGRRVIGTDAPGLLEIMKALRCVSVRAGDDVALSAAIIEAVATTDKSTIPDAQTRQELSRIFSDEHMARSIRSVYEAVCGAASS